MPAALAAVLLAGCQAGSGEARGPSSRPPVARPAEVQAGPPARSLDLLGRPLVIPPEIEVEGLDVGGLSAIAYLGGDRYLALADNQEATPARLFELAFSVGPEGPAPLPGRSAREVAVRAVRLQGFDGESLDGEGVAVTSWGTFLVASETEPSIRQFTEDGRLEGTLPVPAHFRKSWRRRGIAGNTGFEGLALTPDGNTLWTATERALEQDAPGSGGTGASPARLLRYRRASGGFVPAGEFVYPIAAIDDPGEGFAVRGISELAALPDGSLVAMEREFVSGRGNRVELYAVSLAGATDISAWASLAGRRYRPAAKALLFDFAAAGFPCENLEGLTLGPTLPDGGRTLVLVSDDNFDPEAQKTHLVALRLRPAAARP